MPDVSTHSTPQALALFGHGQLPAAQAATVAAHLATCADCRRAAASLPPDCPVGQAQTVKPSGTVLPPAPPRPKGATVAAGSAPAAPVADLPPELANHPKFRIIRELGRGGMGVIYLAEHRVMQKPVALKVISPAVLDNPDALARFHGEVRAAGRLDHPNIARAYDADQAGNLHFLVMEFVEGMSLAQVLEKKGPLPVAHACHYVRQAALGLHHAFEQGMVHRDIKPQNLMLAPKGVVKVLDFGLARLRGERAPGQGLTQANAFMGTPEYVAPEQATDARQADTRADIYSLGCTLYALLTGRPPFVEDTAVKLVLAHIEKEPAPPDELRPDVPPGLSAVVAKMLAKDPARRYQKPVEVAQALAPFVKAGGSSVPAPAAAGTRVGGDTSIARKPGHGATSPPRKAAAAEKVPQAIPVRPAWWKRPAVLAIAGGITAALVVAAAVVVWAARRTSDNGASLAAKANPPASDLRIGQGKAAPGGPQPKGPPPPDGAPGTGGATGDQADPDSGASPTAPARPGGSAAQGPDTRNPGSGQDGSQNARPDPPAQPAGTDKADPIREKLDKARAEFDAEVKKAGELLLEALDKAKEGAQKSGKVQAVDQVNKQRAAFEKDGTVPPTKDGREFQQRKHKARLVLEYAYKAAAAEYTKAKMEARAGAVEQERKRLGQGVPLDAFQPGTVWAGKGLAEWVKLGAKPPKGTFEFEVTLTVLGRDDMHFKARYELRNGQAWEVSGAVTLKGEVAWLARDAKPTQPGQGELKFDFAGQLRDNTLVFKFLGMTADGKSSDGLLPLQLKPK